MHSLSAQGNRIQDPLSPHVLSTWVPAYLKDTPLDKYNQPGLAHVEWWNGLPVKKIFISAVEKEVFAEGDTKVV